MLGSETVLLGASVSKGNGPSVIKEEVCSARFYDSKNLFAFTLNGLCICSYSFLGRVEVAMCVW